jgi:hypothetical protein
MEVVKLWEAKEDFQKRQHAKRKCLALEKTWHSPSYPSSTYKKNVPDCELCAAIVCVNNMVATVRESS